MEVCHCHHLSTKPSDLNSSARISSWKANSNDEIHWNELIRWNPVWCFVSSTFQEDFKPARLIRNFLGFRVFRSESIDRNPNRVLWSKERCARILIGQPVIHPGSVFSHTSGNIVLMVNHEKVSTVQHKIRVTSHSIGSAILSLQLGHLLIDKIMLNSMLAERQWPFMSYRPKLPIYLWQGVRRRHDNISIWKKFLVMKTIKPWW